MPILTMLLWQCGPVSGLDTFLANKVMLKLFLRFLTLTKDYYLKYILNVYSSLKFSVAELYIHTCMDTINVYIYIQTNRYVLSG